MALTATKKKIKTAYPFFGAFDSNTDGKVSKTEWLSLFTQGMQQESLSYQDLFNFAKYNAAKVCTDPRVGNHIPGISYGKQSLPG